MNIDTSKVSAQRQRRGGRDQDHGGGDGHDDAHPVVGGHQDGLGGVERGVQDSDGQQASTGPGVNAPDEQADAGGDAGDEEDVGGHLPAL